MRKSILLIVVLAVGIGLLPGRASAAIVPPSAVNYSAGVSYNLYSNDTEGDCTLATQADLVQTWLQTGASSLIPQVQTEWDVLGAPSVSGVPVSAGLRYWQGAGLDGVYAAKYRPLATTLQYTVEDAIYQLGGVDATVEFPVATLDAPNTGVWTLAGGEGEPGTESHEVALVGYDSQYVYVATWGQVYKVEWAWWDAYGRQVWIVLPSTYVIAGHGPVSSLRQIENSFFGRYHS